MRRLEGHASSTDFPLPQAKCNATVRKVPGPPKPSFSPHNNFPTLYNQEAIKKYPGLGCNGKSPAMLRISEKKWANSQNSTNSIKCQNATGKMNTCVMLVKICHTVSKLPIDLVANATLRQSATCLKKFQSKKVKLNKNNCRLPGLRSDDRLIYSKDFIALKVALH